ncbi:MAG: ABC transporter permease [Acidimicrobiales bacterium]
MTTLDATPSPAPADDSSLNEALGLSEQPESLGRQAWNRFRRHRLAIIGIGMLAFLVASFWVGEWLSPHEVGGRNLPDRNLGPSLDHPFGTDELGRDLFVRAMKGGQFSIRIAVITALVATVIGTVIGALAGYFGKWFDAGSSFVINVLLSVPLILVLIIVGRNFDLSPLNIALLLASLSWLRAARLVRAQVLQLKESEFVQAARAAGAGPGRIIVRHLIPNVIGTLLVEVTLLAGTAIILESTLSFLGLGVQAPATTLGTLIDDAKGAIDTSPWEVLIPGAIVTLIILSFNFIGDALRDALDPKSATE